MKTETPILKDPQQEPTETFLKNILGKELYAVYSELINSIENEFELTYEWRFYKDGNAWLCKILHGKKTVFWLSIFENHIKTVFYFTEKTKSGLEKSGISKKIWEDFQHTPATGKLLPLILYFDQKSTFNDFKAVTTYKNSLK